MKEYNEIENWVVSKKLSELIDQRESKIRWVNWITSRELSEIHTDVLLSLTAQQSINQKWLRADSTQASDPLPLGHESRILLFTLLSLVSVTAHCHSHFQWFVFLICIHLSWLYLSEFFFLSFISDLVFVSVYHLSHSQWFLFSSHDCLSWLHIFL